MFTDLVAYGCKKINVKTESVCLLLQAQNCVL